MTAAVMQYPAWRAMTPESPTLDMDEILDEISPVKAVLELHNKRPDQICARLTATFCRVQRLELGAKSRISGMAICVAMVLWLCAGIGL